MQEKKHYPPESQATKALPYIILAALVFIVYAGTLRAQFVYDDHTQLVENVALRSLRNIPAIFTDPAHTSGSMIFEEIYRPLRATVFAIGYQLWGLNPAGFHAVNILLHLLNTLLIFMFLRWLLQSEFPAFGAALLFGVHPALTEDVCWVCSSSDLLCMFFYLGGLLAFYRFREAGGGKRKFLYGVTLISLVLTLLSKEMGVTFPAAVVAIDVWREGRKAQTPRRWLEYAPLWAVTLGYLAFRATIMTQFAQREAWGGGVLATAGIMARGIKYYIRLLLFPFHLTIIPGINPWLPILSAETILSAALIVALVAFAIFFRRRFPVATMGIILFFVLLLPVSNIVPIKAVVGDRFVYVPSLGFFIVAGALFRGLESFRANALRGRFALAAGGLVILTFLFSVKTVIRSVDWRDGFSLYKAAVEVNPAHPRPREMLAKEYFLRGDYEAAREQTLTALQANPDSVDAHSLLGTVYLQQGLLKQAEQELKTALKLEPNSGDARTNLGLVYKKQGKFDEALEQFQIARKNSPMVSEILNNIGSTYLDKGEPAAALDYLQKAVAVKPDNWEAACNLAYALISLKEYNAAVGAIQSSLRFYPDEPELLGLLGAAQSGAENYPAAAEAFYRALLQNPGDTKTALNLADIYTKMGQYDRAIEIYRKLLVRYPGALRLHLLLSSVFEAAGQTDAALKQLQIAVTLAPDDQALQQKLTTLSGQAREGAGASN